MTIEELRKIGETERATQKKYPHHVHVCIAAGCLSSGSDQVRDALQKEVAESGMQNEVLVKGVGCMGLCSAGPLVSVESDRKMYANVTPEEAPEIVHSIDTGSNGIHTEYTSAARIFPFSNGRRRSSSRIPGISIPNASKTTSRTTATAPW
jgi:bidirectional [NiFe] hydrogenase diaphorase subunit